MADDIMDIDIDVDLGDEGAAMNEEFELEVRLTTNHLNLS